MAPATILCIGMAGSGKTTFMQRLNSDLHARNKPPYVLNLDPAVFKVPFGTNIDIRDSVNYKKVMEDYNLGPNGAIMTSLNLFATKIDQVLALVEKRAPKLDHVIVDTPGQIECFIWSASGAIITDAFASAFPTIIAYIVDTPRTTSPATFMSNMLYACSILYKTKLPMIIVFNKTDVQDPQFAKDWMSDFETFQQVLRNDQELNGEGEGSSGYMGSLMNSLSLMLEEFYRHLDVVGVSAYTGEGFDEFLKAVENKVDEYNRDYKAERDQILKQRKEEAAKKKTQDLTRLMKDIGIGDKTGEISGEPVDSISDIEDVEEDDNDGLVERDEDEMLGRADREYAFDRSDTGIQSRYQQAIKESTGDREAMEKIINQSLT
jgi:GTPase SAR1 family protein